MTTTRLKQMQIPAISKEKIYSPSASQARIDVQKGLVYLQIIISDSGNIVAAMLLRRKAV